jgi:hypothetical protein
LLELQVSGHLLAMVTNSALLFSRGLLSRRKILKMPPFEWQGKKGMIIADRVIAS